MKRTWRAWQVGRKAALSSDWLKAGLGLAGIYGLWRALQRLQREPLQDKVVLITGGSRGLGLLLARHFAQQGCHLVICGRDDKALSRAADELSSYGTAVWSRVCDVADDEQVKAMVDEALAFFGRIDIVVNNAGIIQVGPLETMSLADFGRAMGTNFWGALHVIDAVLPSLRARRAGHIVNIVSIGGAVAVPHLLPYVAAKGALLKFSEGLAAELAKDHIHVSTVVPGLMRTGSPVNALFKGDRAKELAWFSAGDCWPVTSISAERAARRIVRQARSRGGELVISWPAKLLRLAQAIAPNLTGAILGLTNRFLPEAPAYGDASLRLSVRGMHVEDEAPAATSMAPRLKTLARDLNQFGGHVRPRNAATEGDAAPPSANRG